MLGLKLQFERDEHGEFIVERVSYEPLLDRNGKQVWDEVGNPLSTPIPIYKQKPVVVVQTASKRMHISVRMVMRGVQIGWATVRQGHITFHQEHPTPNVVYKILQWPGPQIVDGKREVHNYYDCERVA